jgi:hypothetical protein
MNALEAMFIGIRISLCDDIHGKEEALTLSNGRLNITGA